MATQSPFSWAAQAASSLQAPPWVIDETLNRLVLFLNHVLMSEPQAMQRLARQKGRGITLAWQKMQLQLQATPAGLLERGQFETPDLRLTVTDDNPLQVLGALMRGGKPQVRIEGDVQLAAEVNWLIDNVRWDPEEDLARLIGDASAHTLAELSRQALAALRGFLHKPTSTTPTTSDASGTSSFAASVNPPPPSPAGTAS